MFEPITTGLAVFSFFNSSMELGKFLLAKKSHATTHAALNGISVDVEVVRRNIEAMSSNAEVNYADLSARTGILIDATRALQEATRRFDAKLELLMNASFKEGWEQLSLAAGAASEANYARYLARAEEAFVHSFSLLRNERLITARYGAALAQLQMGEMTNGLATLEKISEIEFDANAPNSQYLTFLRMKIEARDYLATLGSQPRFLDFWRAQAKRFEWFANANVGSPTGWQAQNLGGATRCLETDFERGMTALRTAIEGTTGILKQEGAEVYNRTNAVASPTCCAAPLTQALAPSGVPNVGSTPASSQLPASSGVPNVGSTPASSQLPASSGVPNVGSTPASSQLPASSGVPNVGSTPASSQLPAPPSFPNVGSTPASSQLPAARVPAPSSLPNGYATPPDLSALSPTAQRVVTSAFTQQGAAFAPTPRAPYGNGYAQSSGFSAFDQRSLPLPGTRQTIVVKGVEFAFRFCPPGRFAMGLNKDFRKGIGSFLWGLDGGARLHAVTLTRGFWMLETPTTQRMYLAVACVNPSASEMNRVNGDTSDFPVENVSWDDCQNFLRFINSLGVQPPGFHFRLPTEAEWEYACRAGTPGDFSFACAPNDGMWHMGNSDGAPKRVGLKAPNPWGLVDMHGNVKEWCADWHADYPEGAAIDPIGPTSGKKRVARGGSFGEMAAACSSWDRTYAYKPAKRAKDLGFRFVLASLN